MEACLAQLRPLIEELFELSGSPGLSLGVLHQGVPAYTAHFGRRQASRETPPKDDTLYNVASMTKLMTAGVVSNLVKEGLLEWDVPVRHYLPEFGERKDAVGQHATLRDLLANRTGLSAQATFWGTMFEDILPGPEKILKSACHIPAIGEFRKTFVYSTWGYAIVTSTIERVTSLPFSECVERYIFWPLGMSRSTTNLPGVENVVYKHWVGLDGVAHEFPWSEYRGWSDETGFGGAVVATFTGYNGFMLLDPKSQSAIFVLVNSLPLVDITEMIGQLLLGAVLEENDPPDYIKLAKSVKNANMLVYDSYKSGLRQKRTETPTSCPLKEYEGDYWNDTNIMCYAVHVHGDNQLRISAKGSHLTNYILEPWGGDTFCLPPNRDLELSQSMWPFTSLKSRIFTFSCGEGKVLSFTWHHDITPGSKPETFSKTNGSLHPRL
ncbi:beta-lactamase/transpeptidase-like protein [Karstenula rhodostoma CBS 690.94]|uniref:Beta-lactamase/transpeptidase-like protein n=1 Tax=Karstenula rhodostoma CBS 690.94 TaxID=1392251 RepID=A0A9P4PA15_9PLEO|nr:beta-lactamase/transpeptidase-like protein [Karstenula rhodostoma CBS 690.94]